MRSGCDDADRRSSSIRLFRDHASCGNARPQRIRNLGKRESRGTE